MHSKITRAIDISIFVVAIISIYKGIDFFFATNGFVQGSEFGMQITIVNELALFLIMYGLTRARGCVEMILGATQSFIKTPWDFYGDELSEV